MQKKAAAKKNKKSRRNRTKLKTNSKLYFRFCCNVFFGLQKKSFWFFLLLFVCGWYDYETFCGKQTKNLLTNNICICILWWPDHTSGLFRKGLGFFAVPTFGTLLPTSPRLSYPLFWPFISHITSMLSSSNYKWDMVK